MYSYQRIHLLIALVRFCLCVLPLRGLRAETNARETSLPPAALRDKYENALLPYERMKGIWTNQRHNWKFGKQEPWTGVTETWTVFRDRWRSKVLRTQSGGSGKPPRDYEVVSLEKTWFGMFPNDIVMSKQAASRKDFFERLCIPSPAPSYGIISQLWIPAVLRASQLSSEVKSVHGQPVHILRGVSDNAILTLWLDPTIGYAARKVLLSVVGDPQSPSYEYTAETFRKVSGVFVPTEATLVQHLPSAPVFSTQLPFGRGMNDPGKTRSQFSPAKDKDGKVIMSPDFMNVNNIRLVSIDFEPTFAEGDFLISQPIQNETEVHVQDAPLLHYVWRDGRIVQLLPQKPSGADVRFSRSPDSGWGWVGVTVAILLIAFLLFVFFRRQTAKRNV